jgi:hypothetical protein
LVFIYLFITLEKLLKKKFKFGTVSWNIYLIILLKLIIVIFGYLQSVIFSHVLENNTYNSLISELGLLNFSYFILKIALGVALILFVNKLNEIKNNLRDLESFRTMIKISGVIYVLSGFTGHYGSGLSIIADILIAIIMSNIFSRAVEDAEKHSTEAQNASMPL